MLNIYVFGNGDLVQSAFNAVAVAIGDSTFGSVIKLAMLFAMVSLLFRYMFSRDLMVFGRWMLFYLCVFLGMFVPKTDIAIIDMTNPGQTMTVDNVPIALAALANITTSVGVGITQLTEEVFSAPDDLRYSQTGMLMASQIASASTQFQITDPEFSQSMQSFVQQCVFYDVMLHKYTLNDLMQSNDLWQFVTQNASPARAFLLNGTVTTCQNGVATLNQEWDTAVTEAQAYYGGRLYGNAQNASANLFQYLPDSYGYLANVQKDAVSLMQQNMMINAIYGGAGSYSASTNSLSGMENYMQSKSILQKRLTNMGSGVTSARWLQLTNNVLFCTLIGCFIFIFIASLLPIGSMIILTYIRTLIWLQLWSPIYAIINMALSFYAKAQTLGSAQGGLTMMSQVGIASVNADVMGVASYFSYAVPFLAYGLLTGFDKAFSSMANSLISSSQAGVTNVATELASGSVSAGNFSFGNSSALSSNTGQYDNNTRIAGGMTTVQGTDGATYSFTDGGSSIINTGGAISNIPTSINLAQGVSVAANQMYEHSMAEAKSQGQHYSESMSSAMRDVYDLSRSQGINASSGEGYNITTDASVNNALRNVSTLSHRYATEHGISDSEAYSALTNEYARGELSAKFGVKAFGISGSVSGTGGVSYNHDHKVSSDENTRFSDAASFAKDTGFSNDVQTVLRASHDQSFRATTEEGSRLSDSMSSSYDTALQARSEMSASLQQADSFKSASTYATQESNSINQNLNQSFVSWLSEQDVPGGHGAMGIHSAESIMMNDPQLAQDYAKQFSQQTVQQMATQFANSSSNNLSQQYSKDASSLKGSGAVNSDSLQNHNDVGQKATNYALNLDNNIVDQGIVAQEKSMESNALQQITQGGANMNKQNSQIQSDESNAELKNRWKL
jgi:conjugal transfer mating pair stabilization protein TraG